MAIKQQIAAFQDELIGWRRDFHAHPELAYQEVRTSALVAERLAAMGLEVHRGLGGTGVVGVLQGRGGAGATIGLRADMDALPITEANRFDYASTVPGRMHACGHDGHTTMLLGAARYLAETRAFAGTVCFIFQPAEEGGAGAQRMIEDGLFERFPCRQVFGLHNWPGLPAGSFGIHSGPVMAAADRFEITITGRGGHAALPHHTVDAIVAGAQMVTALQTLVSRNTDPVDGAVVSVTMIQGGSAFNVIPAEATLTGSTRSFRPETRDRLEAGIKRIAGGIATALGAEAEVRYRRCYPPTVNSAPEAALAAAVARQMVSRPEQVLTDLAPAMLAEDFAFMLEQRPGCYLWLGQGSGPDSCMVHHPGYDFNDQILTLGASYWATLVETALPLAA